MIHEKITADIKTAMLNKDKERLSVLRLLKGEFERIDKIIDDAKAVSILKKMYENAVINKNDVEASIINEYLPKILDEAQTRIEVEKLITDNNLTSIGDVMKKVRETFGTSIDNRIASVIVKEILT